MKRLAYVFRSPSPSPRARAAIPTIASPGRPSSSRRRWPAQPAAAATASATAPPAAPAARAARKARPRSRPIRSAPSRRPTSIASRAPPLLLQRLSRPHGLRRQRRRSSEAPRPQRRSTASPVEMVVRNGIAVVVVADWYGQMDDGTPFHGSIVRGLDASDPANIRVLGEAKLGGWVRDTRVVGDVLYAVSEDYGWSYGWDDGDGAGVGSGTVVAGPAPTETVIVSSVSFANDVDQRRSARKRSPATAASSTSRRTRSCSRTTSPARSNDGRRPSSLYLDISDPAGAIVKRGAITVDGRASRLGRRQRPLEPRLRRRQDRARHRLRGGQYGCSGTAATCSSTVDFTNPDAPALQSSSSTSRRRAGASRRASTPTACTCRPSETTTYGAGNGDAAPGLRPHRPDARRSSPARRTIAGHGVEHPARAEPRIFALGNDYDGSDYAAARCRSRYLDVTDPAHAEACSAPRRSATGWAWTPAAGTFKAFTMDATQGPGGAAVQRLGSTSRTAYNNGLQLIEFTPTTRAHTPARPRPRAGSSAASS